ILDAVQAHLNGRPLPPEFWYLVGAEFGLAAFGGVLGRTIGYFDALLADRFTRHVSVRVMEHASRLDLASYEDPVFYDKLERARSVDGPHCDDPIHGRDHPTSSDGGKLVARRVLVLAVAAVAADRRGGSGFSGRKSFCLRGLLA